MPDYFSAAGDLVGGVTSFFAANAEAKGANQAAKYYTEAADITQQSTQLKELQTAREVYQTQGAAKAAIGANGLTTGGSSADVLRSNAQQGAFQKAIVEEQGRIQETAYQGQAAQASAEAAASKSKGKGGLIGGVVSAAAAVL